MVESVQQSSYGPTRTVLDDATTVCTQQLAYSTSWSLCVTGSVTCCGGEVVPVHDTKAYRGNSSIAPRHQKEVSAKLHTPAALPKERTRCHFISG
jgi:hypothetical protein